MTDSNDNIRELLVPPSPGAGVSMCTCLPGLIPQSYVPVHTRVTDATGCSVFRTAVGPDAAARVQNPGSPERLRTETTVEMGRYRAFRISGLRRARIRRRHCSADCDAEVLYLLIAQWDRTVRRR